MVVGVCGYPSIRYSSSGLIMREGRYFLVCISTIFFIAADPVDRPVLFFVSPVQLFMCFRRLVGACPFYGRGIWSGLSS